MLMNLGNAPGASNFGSVAPPPTNSSNGTFLMLGVGTCLALLVALCV